MGLDYIKTGKDLDVWEPQDLTKTPETVKQDLRKYWDIEEVKQKLSQIDKPSVRMFFQFLFMTGVRVSEAVELTRGDLNFRDYFMTVKYKKSRKYERRVLPLHPIIHGLLQVYTASLKERDRVFPFTRQRADQLAKQYGFGNCHRLRHGFAVHWLRSGLDIVTLHRLLGHTRLQTTMEYLRIVPVDQGKELIKLTF